jgi:hypothetical protein
MALRIEEAIAQLEDLRRRDPRCRVLIEVLPPNDARRVLSPPRHDDRLDSPPVVTVRRRGEVEETRPHGPKPQQQQQQQTYTTRGPSPDGASATRTHTRHGQDASAVTAEPWRHAYHVPKDAFGGIKTATTGPIAEGDAMFRELSERRQRTSPSRRNGTASPPRRDGQPTVSGAVPVYRYHPRDFGPEALTPQAYVTRPLTSPPPPPANAASAGFARDPRRSPPRAAGSASWDDTLSSPIRNPSPPGATTNGFPRYRAHDADTAVADHRERERYNRNDSPSRSRNAAVASDYYRRPPHAVNTGSSSTQSSPERRYTPRRHHEYHRATTSTGSTTDDEPMPSQRPPTQLRSVSPVRRPAAAVEFHRPEAQPRSTRYDGGPRQATTTMSSRATTPARPERGGGAATTLNNRSGSAVRASSAGRSGTPRGKKPFPHVRSTIQRPPPSEAPYHVTMGGPQMPSGFFAFSGAVPGSEASNASPRQRGSKGIAWIV